MLVQSISSNYQNKNQTTQIKNGKAEGKNGLNFKSGATEIVEEAVKHADPLMKKLVYINGSPRPDSVSNTYRALQAEVAYFKQQNPGLVTKYFKLPQFMKGCIDCGKCKPGCNITGDNFKEIVDEMKDATDVLLGSPVYLDMPTPQVIAFLTRLNSMAENTNREFFRNKNMHLLSTAFCSGTKTCINVMRGACEMLGFTIPGRSSREYIVKWNDTKLRGGMRREDAIFLENK